MILVIARLVNVCTNGIPIPAKMETDVRCTTTVSKGLVFLVVPRTATMEILVPMILAILQLENVNTPIILLLVKMEMLVHWMMYVIKVLVRPEPPKFVMIVMSVPMIVAMQALETVCTPIITLLAVMMTLVHCTMLVKTESALLVIPETAMMRIFVPMIVVIPKLVFA